MIGTPGVQRFGGDWTEQKLQILREYMAAYTRIMAKDGRFHFEYIDAFAGTGYRERRRGEHDSEEMLFPELATPETERYLEGSAMAALDCEPPFQGFTFIEKSRRRAADLRRAVESRPRGSADQILRGDANECLQGLAREWKRNSRALVFIDPYGMQVEWPTLEALGGTQCVDLWLLVPIAAVNRCLRRDGRVDPGTRRRLDLFFGTPSWVDDLYERQQVGQGQLFEDEDEFSTPDPLFKASWQAVADYIQRRMKTCYANVPDPGILRAGNSPLFMLCFAAANPHAHAAVRIANYLLERDLERSR